MLLQELLRPTGWILHARLEHDDTRRQVVRRAGGRGRGAGGGLTSAQKNGGWRDLQPDPRAG